MSPLGPLTTILEQLPREPVSREEIPSVVEEKAESKERVEMEAAKISTGGVNDFCQWVWGLLFPNKADEVEPALATDQARSAELSRLMEDMKRLMERLQNIREEEKDQQTFEAMLVAAFKAQIQAREEEGDSVKQRLLDAQVERKRLNVERVAKLDTIAAEAKTSKYWGFFEQAAATLGLAGAAVAVSGPVGAVALLVGLGMAVDQLFDDAAKRKVAAFIAGDDSAKQEDWLRYLVLGCGVSTMAISLGIGGAPQMLQIATNLSRGSATAARGMADYNRSCHTADVRVLGHALTKSEEETKKALGEAKRIVESIYQHYSVLAKVTENQAETTMALLRP